MASWCFVHSNDHHLANPRSYRYDPWRNDNWAAARRQMAAMRPDLLLIGGDTTRDGDTHEFAYQMVKDDLETLPWPCFVIPGNMDVGNKHTRVASDRTDRDDVALNMTSARLSLFASYFGPICWTFVHREVRFTGFYAAVAGSGLREEERFWHFLERLPDLPATRHHAVMMHYALFLDDLDEPTFDLRDPEQYLNWYFGIDREPRLRIFERLRAAKVDLVLSGHLHCRREVQVVDGIRFYKTPAVGGRAQLAGRWPDADVTIGFHRIDVGERLEVVFVPVDPVPERTDGYGPFGHPKLEVRDYSVALEPRGAPDPWLR